MSIEVKVPQLPESVTDATLVSWHKKPGDTVTRDENLVDLETDKVVLEVPAPAAGILREIKIQNGTTVTAGQVLAVLEAGVGTAASPAAKPADQPAPQAAKANGERKSEKLAPAARRMVEEAKLDQAQIAGSGRDGRITKADVVQHVAARESAPATKSQAKPAAPAGA